MADPETDRRDVNEAEEAFRRLVVASRDTPGVLELVEATFDQIPQAIQRAIDTNPLLAGLAHRYHGQDVARLHAFSDLVCIVAAIREQHARAGQIIRHHQIEAEIVRRLARCDLCPHGKPVCVDEKVDLGRKATSRTAETLSWSPPLAPAA